jgi:hypothetical protein
MEFMLHFDLFALISAENTHGGNVSLEQPPSESLTKRACASSNESFFVSKH